MGYTKISHLLWTFVAGSAVSWIGIEAFRALGTLPPLQPRLVGVLPLVLAAGLIWAGLRLRRIRAGRPTSLTLIGAARVALLAKASSLVGAALAGAYLALALEHGLAPNSPLADSQTLAAGGGAIGFAILTVTAAVVEYWCRIDPPEDDDPEGGPRGSDPTPA